MRSRERATVSWILALLAFATALAAGCETARAARAPPRVHAVSIDPADHLAAQPDASRFVRELTRRLAANGVDAIYVNAYNVEYGASYRTSYRYNVESDYGRQDLLGKLLAAAHERHIRVFAAFYDHQHRGAWEARPAWRALRADGDYYNPPGTDVQYYLSTGHPGAVAWWRGFLLDLVRRYPDLDGVELREPIVNWWGTEADHNPVLTRAFLRAHPGAAPGDDTWRRFRAATLTRFLHGEIALLHRHGLEVHVTTVASTSPSGALMPASYVARETGFDLDGLLTGRDRPDAIKVELIWQQWARLYGRIAFDPEWTRTAARTFLRQVHSRAAVVVHVELTDFGHSAISVEEFLRTLRAADLPAVAGVDFYSVSLADRKRAWPAVRAAYGHRPRAGVPHDRRVLVLFDRGGSKVRARLPLAQLQRAELVNLLGHFDVKWDTRSVERYRRGELLGYDTVVYLASVYGNAPTAFLSDVSVFGGRVVWIGQNLFQLERSGVRLPFGQRSAAQEIDRRPVVYRGVSLPARGELIATHAGAGARVRAVVGTGPRRLPFVLQSGRFWYVAGSPFSYLSLDGAPNGRYLAFADLLHEMLGIRHVRSAPRAFIRLEDVDPLTDPGTLRAAVAPLARRHAPFLVSVTPFHVAPGASEVALSERPELVAVLRDAVAAGGAIVLDGATHAYRGATGRDAEFWDTRNGGGVREDGDRFVRAKVERALAELWRCDLHPLAWETPAYLATPFDYGVFAEYFSTFVERRVYGTWTGDAYRQGFPYTVDPDVFGGRILPENLGVLRPGGGVEAIAARLVVVRDATAGARVPVGTDPALVGGLADRLHALGYRLVDLYALPNLVQASGRVELTGSGRVSVPVRSGWVLSERLIGRRGSLVRERRTFFPGYARPEWTVKAVPRRGLVSLQAVAPTAAEALVPTPPTTLGTHVVTAFFVAGLGGVGVLAGAYLLARRSHAP